MKKNLYKIYFYILTISMIIGCSGGSSSDSSTEEETTNSSSSPVSWSPKTTNVTCDLSAIDGGRYSAIGDVTVSCQKDNKKSIRYELNKVKTLVVRQIVKHKYLTIENSSDKLHTIYDYEKGTISYSGDIEGTSYHCIETYPSIVPETLINSRIEKILNWQGNSNDRVSTTCTDLFYNAKIDSVYNMANEIKSLSFFGINYTLTDDRGRQHFITIEF